MQTFYVGQPVTVTNAALREAGQQGAVKFIDTYSVGVMLYDDQPGFVSDFAPSDLAPIDAAPVAEPIIIADILDALVIAIEVARINTAGNVRWLNALETGYNWLVQQDSIIYDLASHELTIESASEPGTYWHANGECGCPAGRRSGICYHWAAARLVRRALDVQARTPKPTPKPTAAARQRAYDEVHELFIS